MDEAQAALLTGTAMKLSSSGLDSALYDFLQAVGLANLGTPLGKHGFTLEGCVQSVQSDRPAFLSRHRASTPPGQTIEV